MKRAAAGASEQARELLETLLAQTIELNRIYMTMSGDGCEVEQCLTSDSLGWICMRLGLFEESAVHLEKAVQLATKIHGTTSHHTARSKLTLAVVLIKLSKRQEAEELCKQLMRALQQHYVNGIPLSQDSINQLNVLADVYTSQTKHADAVSTWEVAADDAAKALGTNHALTVWATTRQHHAVLRAYLDNGQSQPALANKVREKLVRLSPAQFYDLCSDVFDELQRRQAARAQAQAHPERSAGQEQVSPCLPPRPEFHKERNEVRRKSSALRTSQFRDLCAKVFCEMNSRFPHFDADDKRADVVSSISEGGAVEREASVEREHGMHTCEEKLARLQNDEDEAWVVV